MSKKRILFVDDEPNLLEGLRNLLRKQRHQWDMVFACDAPTALAELERAPFDLIVSDMRMPGMDGAALLRTVMDRHPTVARIMLSGYSDREDMLRALPVTHQFLSKPCDVEVLRSAIERTCRLQTMLEDQTIRAVVGRLTSLPSVPAIYWELMKIAARPEVALSDLADVIEQDPAMTAKILQLVNSAYFGLPRTITSIQQGVLYLGVELLKGLTLAASAFTTLERAPCDGFSLVQVQEHSLRCARLAQRLVRDRTLSDEALTAGLVHDVGTIILAVGAPLRFADVIRSSQIERVPRHRLERDVFGTTHAEIGAYLLGVWGLPFPIVEAVAFHHNPGAVASGPRDVLAAVHLADGLVDIDCVGEADTDLERRIDLSFLTTAGFAGERSGWMALAREGSRG